MRAHLVDRGVVSDHHAVEAPLIAEQVGDEPFVGCGGNAVDKVERCHYRKCAFIHGGLVGGEVFIVHALAAHIHSVVVAAGLRRTVERKMFHAGSQLVVAGQVALIAADHCTCDL